jgi:hypothetical protein
VQLREVQQQTDQQRLQSALADRSVMAHRMCLVAAGCARDRYTRNYLSRPTRASGAFIPTRCLHPDKVPSSNNTTGTSHRLRKFGKYFFTSAAGYTVSQGIPFRSASILSG